MRTDIEFRTDDGTTLRGWHYPPQKKMGELSPVVVMCHGFSGVKGSLTKYAEVFAAAGLSVVLYDHRGFGDSDGRVRQEIDPYQQIADFRDALTFAQTLPGVDPKRIGVWGSSFAGAHAMMLAANDKRVKCVVAQVPLMSGHATIQRLFRPDRLAKARELFAQDRAARMRGEEPMRVPVFATDDQLCALPPPVSDRFIAASEGEDPLWRNEVTLRSIEMLSEYEPGEFMKFIAPTPLLLVVGAKDIVAAADLALSAYETALHPKKLVIHPGGHFATYYQHFEQSSGEARDWFLTHLAEPDGQ